MGRVGQVVDTARMTVTRRGLTWNCYCWLPLLWVWQTVCCKRGSGGRGIDMDLECIEVLVDGSIDTSEPLECIEVYEA